MGGVRSHLPLKAHRPAPKIGHDTPSRRIIAIRNVLAPSDARSRPQRIRRDIARHPSVPFSAPDAVATPPRGNILTCRICRSSKSTNRIIATRLRRASLPAASLTLNTSKKRSHGIDRCHFGRRTHWPWMHWQGIENSGDEGNNKSNYTTTNRRRGDEYGV